MYIVQQRTWAGIKEKNQCCGSGMFIPDPDFYPSRISDPKTATKERGEKKFVVTNFTKLKTILVLKCWKKIWANFPKIIELFTQKMSLSS
jgi:hypothetical protein